MRSVNSSKRLSGDQRGRIPSFAGGTKARERIGRIVKRFAAMMKSVGWLWALIFLVALVLGYLITWIYFLILPGLILAMVYFTIMRYDDEGNRKDT